MFLLFVLFDCIFFFNFYSLNYIYNYTTIKKKRCSSILWTLFFLFLFLLIKRSVPTTIWVLDLQDIRWRTLVRLGIRFDLCPAWPLSFWLVHSASSLPFDALRPANRKWPQLSSPSLSCPRCRSCQPMEYTTREKKNK